MTNSQVSPHDNTGARAEVEGLRQPRSDRHHRRLLCRDALLAWLDDTTDADAGTRVSLEAFVGGVDGLAFTDLEVDLAAEHLVGEGLIATLGSSFERNHVLAHITGPGQEHRDRQM